MTLPAYGAVVGSDWEDWDGSEDVTATNGQQIAVVEVDAEDKARAGGLTEVTANGG